MRVTNLPDPVTPPTAPTVPAVAGMTLTQAEIAVIQAIREVRRSGKLGMIVLRVEPADSARGKSANIQINQCTATQFVAEKTVS